ncbi:DUF6923 family protein [Microbacterium phyllosphaerae]|uniref:DUF7927 domain-containing protein n=1 Tax=Microbacterium phyllosphaerae TaxID=124798 RepID=UPI003D6590B2
MQRRTMFTERKIGRVPLRALAMTAIAAVVSTFWVAFGIAPAPAAAAPFNPQVPMVWISQGDGAGGTLLSQAAQANGQVSFTPVGSADTYNAIGFRQSNSYIYGMTPPLGPDPDARSHNIVRINSDGQVDGVVGSIPQAPDYTPQNSLIAGTFGEGQFADRFLVTRTQNDLLYVINPNNGNYQELALTGPALQSPNGASDITAAYGYLWGVAQDGDYIIRIDPVGQTRREIAVPANFFTDTGSYGGAWTYGNGNLAFSNNNSGVITQISITNPGSNNPTFNKISTVQGPSSGNNDGTSAPGDPADLAIVKTGPATVTVGGQITWTLQVTNNGPGGSSGFIVNDTVPAGITNVSSPDGECAVVGSQLTCTGDQLLSGQSTSFTLTGIAGGSPRTIVNTATVLGYEADPVPANNSSSATTTIVPVAQPGFSVTKTASTTAASPGESVTYTVRVQNTGNVAFTAANPASFTDNLSGVLDDASYNNDASGGATYAAPTLSWSGAVPVGQFVDITYSVTVRAAGSGDGNMLNAVVPGQSGSCATCQTQTGVQAFSLTKAASSGDASPGEVVTYTVTVTNTGTVAYTAGDPASFTDDLSGVLDDATYNQDASSGATYAAPILSWAGAVGVGQSVTVTYSVTVAAAGSGDGNLQNSVVPGSGGDCATCQTETGLQSFSVSKSVSSATASPGDVLTYTVTVTNTGEVAYTAADPARFTDDLSAVLDDATYNQDASGGATYAAPILSWAGAVGVGQSVSVTYSVTVGAAGSGDGNLDNAVVPGAGGDCVTCGTQTDLRSFAVTKVASSATATPGSVVTYTVTVANTGQSAFTAANPASFTDDLSDVLDDAAYNDDASGGASYAAPVLSWSGAIPVGQSVSITYSVTVRAAGSGDGNLDNTVVPGDGGDCVTCGTETDLLSYSVVKQASSTQADIGDSVGYMVTVTNTGQAAYTAADPASFVDDLSGVLDDATYNGDATQGAQVVGTTLTWSGALGVGQSIVVTYSVTVNDPPTGDRTLRNVVTTPLGDCVVGSTDPDCSTSTDVASFSLLKTANTTVVDPGGVVTYTITVVNTGETDIPNASFTDDMSGVLDDASYNDDATNGATLAGTTLSWSGALAQGQTIVITYSVTVNLQQTGDQILRNAVVAQGPGYCVDTGECTTETAGRSFSVTKTASASVLDPGDVITYTVTVVNTGQAAYTAASPAAFTDNLSGVLDDATYNDDASSGASVTGSVLNWSGAIPVGGSVSVTYSFTVNDPRSGDQNLTNAVVPLGGGHCAEDCSVSSVVRSYTVSKAASTGIAIPGSVVTYTVTVTNTGDAAYTAQSPATFTDDMSDVVDDATYNGDATNGATYAAPTLSWAGAVPVGQSVTVVYSVTVNAPRTGDSDLTNSVIPGDGECEDCETVTDVQSFSVVKTASSDIVIPGDVLEYRIVVTNTGNVAYTDAAPASFTDDLSAVLDDATYNGDATNGATVTGQVLSWADALAVGQSVTITYSVTVDSPATGDRSLVNAVVPGANGGGCEAEGDCSTETAERTFAVSKSGSATTVPLDGVLTYTILVTNTGTAPYTAADPASFTDDLSEVLDDATYNGDASSGAVVTGQTLAWAGPLAVGQSITVTYSVTVNNPSTGDHLLTNGVVPDDGTGGECTPEAPCSVETPIAAFHVTKTSDAEIVVPGQTVQYTITVSNIGRVDYTAATPASFSDDLSDVLDDAVYNDDATGGAVYTEPVLSWSGPLAIGDSIEITYSATVNRPATGDDILDNAVLTPDGSGGECSAENPAEDCDVVSRVASYSVEKTSDAETARPGDVITYTITVVNTGQVDYAGEMSATFTDDMTDLLDDATYNDDAIVQRDDEPEAPGDELTFEDPLLEWTGPLAIGETAVVTYTATVDAPATGDRIATNVVLSDSEIGGDCIDEESCAPETLIASYEVVKRASAVQVTAGQVVGYTVTVTNTGQVDYTEEEPASFTDDLADVLDEATYNGDASAGATVSDGVLSWSGPLEVGASIQVTYSVTVMDGVRSGSLRNAVIAPADSGSVCAPGALFDGCSTDTAVVPPLATTGGDAAAWTAAGLSALLALLIGGGFFLIGRRRRTQEA